jgi:predicted DNA binding protein/ActR/RegA family two-component response regulator
MNGTGPATTARGSAEGDGTRILLVDDDEPWLSSTAELLEHQREAFAVNTAPDLATASSTFAEDDPDCVVCDYDLGDETGLELLSEVRERAEDRPFILLTGRGSESVASDAIGRGVTDYVPKGSLDGRSDSLAHKIETAVDAYRAELALARERQSKEAMLDILTATSSRNGLAREFCRHLIETHGYELAWIGTRPRSAGIVIRAAAGAEGYLDDGVDPRADLGAATEPALVALARREPRVVAPLRVDDAEEGWRAAASARGFESAVAVPIDHEGTVFGVLAVYGSEPTTDAEEVNLLAEYGEAIGYALRSATWKESLLSATPVAVEVELADESVSLVAVERCLPGDTRLEVLTEVPREEAVLYVVGVDGATATEVRECVGTVDTIGDVTVTGTGERVRCELVVDRPTPGTVLAQQGGRVVEATVERGRASVTAVSSDAEDARPMIEAIESTYPDAGVRPVRSDVTTDRNPATDEVIDHLTYKQRRAIELAFYNGFFERPREHTTTEVAEKFGVTRQTFTQHLRAGERKLLSSLLERRGEPPEGRPR